MPTKGFTTLSTATSPAAPEEDIPCSFALNPIFSISIYNIKAHIQKYSTDGVAAASETGALTTFLF